MPLLSFFINIYSNELFFYNLILIVVVFLHYLVLIKLRPVHKILFQLLQILVLDLQQYQKLKINLQTKLEQDQFHNLLVAF